MPAFQDWGRKRKRNPYFRRGYIKFPGADRDRSDPSGSMAALSHNKNRRSEEETILPGVRSRRLQFFLSVSFHYAAALMLLKSVGPELGLTQPSQLFGDRSAFQFSG